MKVSLVWPAITGRRSRPAESGQRSMPVIPSLLPFVRLRMGCPSCLFMHWKAAILLRPRGFKKIQDPYGDASFPAIPAIRPDFAIIHVQYADTLGNGVILGPKYEDGIMVRAAKSVILCAERIVESNELPVPIDHVDIPSPLVDAVVETPKGAWPGSCYAEYEVDEQGVRALQLMEDSGELRAYLESLQ